MPYYITKQGSNWSHSGHKAELLQLKTRKLRFLNWGCKHAHGFWTEHVGDLKCTLFNALHWRLVRKTSVVFWIPIWQEAWLCIVLWVSHEGSECGAASPASLRCQRKRTTLQSNNTDVPYLGIRHQQRAQCSADAWGCKAKCKQSYSLTTIY